MIRCERYDRGGTFSTCRVLGALKTCRHGLAGPRGDAMIRIACMLLCLRLAGGAVAAPLPLKADPKESEAVLKLRRQQVETAQQALSTSFKEYSDGRLSFEAVAHCSRLLLDARLALTENRTERVAACKEQLDLLQKAERLAKGQLDAGKADQCPHLLAGLERRQVQVRLLQEAGEDRRAIRQLPRGAG